MSLAFLFKKTWHPSTLQNSEKVWIAEQKDAAEKKRIEELTKQVREEQQVRELEEMQVCSWLCCAGVGTSCTFVCMWACLRGWYLVNGFPLKFRGRQVLVIGVLL